VASTTAQLRSFVDDLAAARIGGTFNQYRESDGDDRGAGSPQIRAANLVEYLRHRVDAPVMLVGEAAGWRGSRYSGLCLLCERQIDEAATPLRRSSRNPQGWSEPSATVVQDAIAPWADSVLLWNLVPTHPRRAGVPHSNRAPTAAELRGGAEWLRRLLEMVHPEFIGAIGRHAAAELGAGVPMVRHPSHGGARLSRARLSELLTQWLGARSTLPPITERLAAVVR
jgi:hypothetical protein